MAYSIAESTALTGGGSSGSPFLVSSRHNSHADDDEVPPLPTGKCPNARLLKGVCRSHNNVQFYLFPCKSRDCEHCGPLGRLRHAHRIDYGIKRLGECWFMVLTFAEREALDPAFKSTAVRKVNRMLAHMRKVLLFDFEAVKTWELQKSGRIHCNVIFNFPWCQFLPMREFQRFWGARVTFQHVTDAAGMANYVTKVSGEGVTDDSIGRYVMKAGYQAVPRSWGRRVSYSRGWPKEIREKSRVVDWSVCDQESRLDFYQSQVRGELYEVSPGRWFENGRHCGCFGVRSSSLVNAVFKVFPGSRLVESG